MDNEKLPILDREGLMKSFEIDDGEKGLNDLRDEYKSKLAQLDMVLKCHVEINQDVNEQLEYLRKANANVVVDLKLLEKAKHRFFKLSVVSGICLIVWVVLVVSLAMERFF